MAPFPVSSSSDIIRAANFSVSTDALANKAGGVTFTDYDVPTRY